MNRFMQGAVRAAITIGVMFFVAVNVVPRCEYDALRRRHDDLAARVVALEDAVDPPADGEIRFGPWRSQEGRP